MYLSQNPTHAAAEPFHRERVKQNKINNDNNKNKNKTAHDDNNIIITVSILYNTYVCVYSAHIDRRTSVIYKIILPVTCDARIVS